MKELIGALIRRERIRRHYSQSGLCRGICAVSYLSKIELGQTEASKEIIKLLFERLGLSYETDEVFLKQAKAKKDVLYEALYDLNEDLFLKELEWMKQAEKHLLASCYAIDYRLFLLYENVVVLDHDKLDEAGLEELKDFCNDMEVEQYALYLCLSGWQKQEESCFRKAMKLYPNALLFFFYGAWLAEKGYYVKSLAQLDHAYALALQECKLHLALKAKYHLAMAYTNLEESMMLESFRQCIALANQLSMAHYVDMAYYNIAAYYLEQGQAEEALRHLEKCGHRDGFYYHKYACIMEKLGRLEEAKGAVEQGLESIGDIWIDRQMLEVVHYRLTHPDYKSDPLYIEQLLELFAQLQKQRPKGYVIFHLQYVLEVLEAQRKYKEAYSLLKKFSYIS